MNTPPGVDMFVIRIMAAINFVVLIDVTAIVDRETKKDVAWMGVARVAESDVGRWEGAVRIRVESGVSWRGQVVRWGSIRWA